MESLDKPSSDKDKESKAKKDDKDDSSRLRAASILAGHELEDSKEDDKSESILGRFLRVEKPNDEDSESEDYEDLESGEEDAPLEHMSEEEEQTVAAAIREEVRSNRDNEPKGTESDQVVHEALDSYDNKIIEEHKDPDQALDEVLSEYDIDAEQELVPDEAEQQEALPEGQEINLADSEGLIPLNEELASDEDEPETSANTATTRGTPPPRPPRGVRVPASAGAGGAPVASAASTSAANHERTRRERNQDMFTGFIIGGIVGYLIGRRRGRIKTERKLLPVQKKLEKQVNNLNNKLERQEFTIRKLVKAKAEADHLRPDPIKQEKLKVREKVLLAPLETTKRITKEVVKAAPKAAEVHIGKLLISNREERARTTKPEGQMVTTSNRETLRNLKEEPTPSTARVETMSHQDLLKLSEKVVVDGTSLREIYETQLIGEKGLRRLVSEHLRGGDIKRALKNEITERQIDFERDPSLRDMASTTHGGGIVGGTSSVVLDQMIKKAEASVSSNQEEVAFLRAKSDFEGKQMAQKAKQARFINTLFLIVITMLIAGIIILSLSRR